MALIFAALVQLGFIYERQIGIENAVREGARRAATFTTTSASAANTNGAAIWCQVFGTGGLLQSNVENYDGLAILSPAVTYTDQTASSGLTSVLVQVSVTYKHPLFIPLINAILDGLDGHTDSALWISTSSQFTVQNDATTSSSVGGTVTVTSGSC